jgi:1-acyl-sn-glycerol-3-phosphate acyltransferase
LHALGDAFPGFDDDRGKFDTVGKVWCRAYLGMTGCYPSIGGDVDRLSVRGGVGGNNGPCLFVANHASFLDIAVLCCALEPTFKFIAKDSLEKFPGVGRQLVGVSRGVVCPSDPFFSAFAPVTEWENLCSTNISHRLYVVLCRRDIFPNRAEKQKGEHLLINRDDKRSQLRMFKRARKYLDEGVSIMAFPEGARSPDGRLMEFKGGMFSLAIKTGVPIVPLSLANTHAVFPSVGFLPVQDGKDKLRVYVHDPIDVAGKDEGEIAAEVRRALLSELPWDQHPLADEGDDGAVGG